MRKLKAHHFKTGKVYEVISVSEHVTKVKDNRYGVTQYDPYNEFKIKSIPTEELVIITDDE